jgi:hypothetical protein
MSEAVRRAIVGAAVLTLGALAALFASTGIRARVIDAYLIALAGVLMLFCIRKLRAMLPERTSSRFDDALAGMRAVAPASSSLSIERDVELSRMNGFHFHTRVRPILREAAGFRLRRRYGVDLDREPMRASEFVPSDAWEVVRPDRPPPRDRLAPGPRLDELRRVVDEIERL